MRPTLLFLTALLLALAKDHAAAKAKAMKARAFVLQRQRETMQTLAKSL